jgi:hypothetical protein
MRKRKLVRTVSFASLTSLRSQFCALAEQFVGVDGSWCASSPSSNASRGGSVRLTDPAQVNSPGWTRITHSVLRLGPPASAVMQAPPVMYSGQ